MNVFDIINDQIWPAWGNLICVIIGAFISSFVTIIYAKKKLKLDLQIQTVDQYFELSSKLIESHLSTAYNTSLKAYNIAASGFHKSNEILGINDEYDKIKRQLQFTSLYSESNQKSVSDALENWQYFSNAYLSLVRLFETKQIILYKFVGIHDQLLYEYNLISKYYTNIYHSQNLEISSSITNASMINEEIINKIEILEKEFFEKKSDIYSIIYDLNTELQRTFLRKVFKYNVPRRRPLDKSITVYRAGYKFNRDYPFEKETPSQTDGKGPNTN